MYLILAIIVGLGILLRVGSDKAGYSKALKDNEEKRNKMKEEYDEFYNSYTDEELELKYSKEISLGSEFANKASNEVREIIGGTPTHKMVLMWMLAEECKIPRNIIYFGVGSPARGKNMAEWEFVERCNGFIKFIRSYDKKLRDNGMVHELLYVRASEENRARFDSNQNLWKSVHSSDINPRVMCLYTWWSARYYKHIYGPPIY